MTYKVSGSGYWSSQQADPDPPHSAPGLG